MNFKQNHLSRIAMFMGVATMVLLSPIQAQKLTEAFKQRALAAMKHSDPEKRKVAFRSFQHLGNDSLEDYEKLLNEALLFHQGNIRNAMRTRANPYIEHFRLREEILTERNRVLALIHTDYKKDPGKIRMLQGEMEKTGRKFNSLKKLATKETESIDKKVSTALQALTEIQWQLMSLERKHEGDPARDLPDQRDLEDEVEENIFEVEEWREQVASRKATRAEIETANNAEKHNADCKWAGGGQKTFSNHLNGQRAIMGLRPLLLEEMLSKASFDHSSDMRSMGFFSHTSPVPGKRSPADRARKAKFRGSWTGENIFMGSPSPMPAYGGWFGSDGHRFIMFTRGGSNVIGVGISGGHWTMMTGRQ